MELKEILTEIVLTTFPKYKGISCIKKTKNATTVMTNNVRNLEMNTQKVGMDSICLGTK